MPRAADGTVTLVTGNPVVTGTAISADVQNATLADLAAMIQDCLSRTGKGSMQVQLTFSDGTVALPGVAFSNENNSGLYRAGAADIAITITGTKRQEWTTTGTLVNGTLGVSGATTLSSTLSVADNATTKKITAAPSAAGTDAVVATGSNSAVAAGGSGIVATAGDATAGGGGSGYGVRGIATLATSGAQRAAVRAEGAGSGAGVDAVGGANSGVGGTFLGGATNGNGINATGDGIGVGVYATGGDNSGAGVVAIGGDTNGLGLLAQGAGTGVSVSIVSPGGTTNPTAASLRLQLTANAPTTRADGDIYLYGAGLGGRILAIYMGGVEYPILTF